MMADYNQYMRVAKLLVYPSSTNATEVVGLDLSEMHFTFEVHQSDYSAPNTAEVRVFNLKEETVLAIRKSFNRVVIEAGYDGNSGVIFEGTIKQFRIGKINNTTTFLDILAADGDIGFNFGVVNKSLPAGSTPQQRIAETSAAMGMPVSFQPSQAQATGGVLPRGKVLFGMAKARMHDIVRSQQWSWSIQKNKVQVIPLTGYLPNEAVEINSYTGMVGVPRATENGIEVNILLNAQIIVGGLIKLNAADVNQTVQQNPSNAPFAYNNPYGNPELLAKVTNDGVYRVYVAEHIGDTRGTEFYTSIIALAVDIASKECKAYG